MEYRDEKGALRTPTRIRNNNNDDDRASNGRINRVIHNRGTHSNDMNGNGSGNGKSSLPVQRSSVTSGNFNGVRKPSMNIHGNSNSNDNCSKSLLDDDEEEEGGATITSSSSLSSSIAAATSSDTALLIRSAAKSVLDNAVTPDSAVSFDEEDDDNYLEVGEADANTGRDGESFCTIPDDEANNEIAMSALQSLRTEKIPALPEEQDRKRFAGCLAAVLACAYNYNDMVEGDDEIAAESMAYLDMNESYSSDEDLPYEGMEKNSASLGSYSDNRGAKGSSYHRSVSSSRCNSNQHQHCQRSSVSRGVSFDSMNEQEASSRNNTSRHRKRRYDVLSRLLVSSADLLMLEKSQTKAFLPMLAKILVPETKQQRRSKTLSKNNHRNKETAMHQSSVNTRNLKNPPPMYQYPDTRQTATNSRREEIESSESIPQSQMFEGTAKEPSSSFTPVDVPDDDFFSRQVDEIEYLRPFLESLTPGAGFRCLAMLLLQHLLHSEEGYDARIRHVIKTLGVIVLVHDMEVELDLTATGCGDGGDFIYDKSENFNENQKSGARQSKSKSELVVIATRKFESLEHCIAFKLIQLSRQQQQTVKYQDSSNNSRINERNRRRRKSSTKRNDINASATGNGGGNGSFYSREQIMRGVKIGGAAVVAGTLFAVTGGLAAPSIAAGIAAIGGGTAAAAVLTSTAAVTTIFGISGGGLAAYKMQRRTQGLTEFEFHKESSAPQGSEGETGEDVEAELFSTICISGWLRDKCDFQRPWGVSPSKPRISDRLELLQRFYSVYRPDHVVKSKKILARWKGEERELWKLLRHKYGKDPDNFFPLDNGPRHRDAVTLEQEEIIDQLFVEIGYTSAPKGVKSQPTPLERMRAGWKQHFHPPPSVPNGSSFTLPRPTMRDNSLYGPHSFDVDSIPDGSSTASSTFDSTSIAVSTVSSEQNKELTDQSAPPKHLATVWDYKSIYGGELYTVKWESHLLEELCDSVSDLAFDLVSGGAAQFLRHTALSAFMSAIAWPYALVNAANMIDGTWTLAVERADAAGRELARSLLFSRAGNRPVTLIGFSFGARAIYSCLKELARFQEKWEDIRVQKGVQWNVKADYAAGADADEGSERFYQFMREPASVVEDAILIGLPNHLSLSSWKSCRRVVAGRLVNCFSRGDLILSLMFQFKRLKLKPVCGVCPVNVSGVENIDVTDLVSGHEDLCLVTGEILKRARFGQPFRYLPIQDGTTEVDEKA